MTLPFKLSLPGYKILYTGIYTVNYQSYGLLYCFNIRVTGHGKDMCFRITSKVKNFDKLFSIDILTNKQNAIIGIRVKDQKDDDSKVAAQKIIYHIISGKKHPIQEGIVDKLVMWSSVIIPIVSLLMLLYFYVVAVIKWGKEKLADSVYENQVNKKLFEGQNGKEPEFQIYNKLIHSIDLLIKDNKIKSILICGIPGTSKTHIVRRTLYFNGLQSGSDYTILKGSTMGMIDFVSALYENNGKIIVLDDFDSPLNDDDTVNILKSATDSYSKRIISFPRAKMIAAQSQGQADYKIPQKFEFTGKLIIITNKKFNEIDKALISRCLTIEINFTPEEFLENIKSMLKYIMPDVDMNVKLEVFGYIEILSKKHKIEGLNFRTFQSAISIRLLYPDNWKEMIAYVLK